MGRFEKDGEGKGYKDYGGIYESANRTFAIDASGYSSEEGTISFSLMYSDTEAFTDQGNWKKFLNAVGDVTVGVSFGEEDNYFPYVTYGYETSSSAGEITQPAPEPATLAVLGLGLAGLGLVKRRRK